MATLSQIQDLFAPASAFVVFAVPYREALGSRGGISARVRAADAVFRSVPRLYVDLVQQSDLSRPAQLAPMEHGSFHLSLNVDSYTDRLILEWLIEHAALVYVHTLHAARLLVPYVSSGTIVVDHHGLAPEEARLEGNEALALSWEAVERSVIKQSDLNIVVSAAMAEHFRRKYPDSDPDYVVLPIVPESLFACEPDLDKPAADRSAVAYVGGLQRWQNIDAMIEACIATRARNAFTFLSPQYETLDTMLRARGADGVVARFASVPEEEVADHLRRQQFGFVLRDDDPVNRVACPTKLMEYLWFGVVPIVKSPRIGDLQALGLHYVTLAEFVGGRVPDEKRRAEMRDANASLAWKQVHLFHAAANRLRRLRLRPRTRSGRVVGLAQSRGVEFPSYAELYCYDEEVRYHAQTVGAPYDSIAFDIPEAAETARIRFMPLAMEKIVRITGLEIELAEGSAIPERIGFAVEGVPVEEGWRIDRAGCIGFTLSPPGRLRRVTMKVAFASLGAEADDPPAASVAAGETVEVRMRMGEESVWVQAIATGATAQPPAAAGRAASKIWRVFRRTRFGALSKPH